VLPGVAPVAMSKGGTRPASSARGCEGREHGAFRYRDKGNLATIGRAAAVAGIGYRRGPEHVLSPDPSEQDELVELARAARAGSLHAAGGRWPSLSARTERGRDPASAFAALPAVVRDIARGLTITLIPHDKELTAKEADVILNMSRPFLVRLLDRGEIPFTGSAHTDASASGMCSPTANSAPPAGASSCGS
jgi:hypothetical protein